MQILRSRAVLWLCALWLWAGTAAGTDVYSVLHSRIFKNGLPTQWIGANALDVFSVTSGDMSAMDSWGLDMVREVVVNMRDNPIRGGPVQVGGTWFYSLQSSGAA